MIWQGKTAPAHEMILSVANESEQTPMPRGRDDIRKLILRAAEQARQETSAEPEKGLTQHVRWPIDCQVGPGLEGAIACESRVGYVNGTRGWLIYRGYNIFDLAAHSSFEEVSYLLLHGRLPRSRQLERFKSQLISYRPVPDTLRHLMGFPVEHMHPMAALRLGTSLLRMQQTYRDEESARPDAATAISADEDSIPMELKPWGDPHAIYEFKGRRVRGAPSAAPPPSPGRRPLVDAAGVASAYRLIAGVPTLAAAVGMIHRVHGNAPDPGSASLPAVSPRLSDGYVLLIQVPHLSDGGLAVQQYHPHLARREFDLGVLAFLCHQLGVIARAADQLSTPADVQFHVVNMGTQGDIAQGQGISRADLRSRPREHLISHLQFIWGQDVPFFPIRVME